MQKSRHCNCIAYASGVGGADPRSGMAPLTLASSCNESEPFLQAHWLTTLHPNCTGLGKAALPAVVDLSRKLSKAVYDLATAEETFAVIGGDHSCAIGTWSGAATALRPKGDIGLMWIDAHMDSHTPHTSISQNIHGMPLAVLLGQGYQDLTQGLSHTPALKPHNLCLIGVRSYEPEEAEFLSQQGVRIFFMEEVNAIGLDAVIQQALDIVNQHTVGYGISLDVDAIDPQDFPATGIQVSDGIRFSALSACFQHHIRYDQRFLGIDIAEFIPALDVDGQSQQHVKQLLNDIFR